MSAEFKHWEDEWVRSVALADASANQPLTPLTYAPQEWTTATGVKFSLLNTVNELRMEGAELRHCVGGYGDHVRIGLSLIYKATFADGARAGTIELRPHSPFPWQREDGEIESRHVMQVVQFKSFGNSTPNAVAQAAAREFLALAFPINTNVVEKVALPKVVRNLWRQHGRNGWVYE